MSGFEGLRPLVSFTPLTLPTHYELDLVPLFSVINNKEHASPHGGVQIQPGAGCWRSKRALQSLPEFIPSASQFWISTVSYFL